MAVGKSGLVMSLPTLNNSCLLYIGINTTMHFKTLCVCLTVLTGVLSFVGGNVSGIILGILLSVAAYKIKNKVQKKSNQTPVYDSVRERYVSANLKTIPMEENDAYGSRIPTDCS